MIKRRGGALGQAAAASFFEEPFAAICLGSQVMVASLQGNMLGSLIPANLVESLEHKTWNIEREREHRDGGGTITFGDVAWDFYQKIIFM